MPRRTPTDAQAQIDRLRDAAFLSAFTARTGQSVWDVAPLTKWRLRGVLAAAEPLDEQDLRFLSGLAEDDMVAYCDLPRDRAIPATAAQRKDA